MKLTDFDLTTMIIPSHLVTVRELAKVLQVPDQMIHQYTTKGTLVCNRDYGQKRVDMQDPITLTWLIKYVAKRPEIKAAVVAFVQAHVELDDEDTDAE